MRISPLGMVLANKIHKYLLVVPNHKKLIHYASAFLAEASSVDCPSKLREAIRGVLMSGVAVQRDPVTNKVTWVEHTAGTNRGYNCLDAHAQCVETFGRSANVMATVMFVANWGDE